MTTTTTKRRRGHYTPQPVKHTQTTPRDLLILLAFIRYRFLTSRHILDLIEGSNQQLLRRLRDLMDAGYLMPMRNPEVRVQNGGSKPKIYGITTAGANLLAAQGLIPKNRTNWTRRNADVNDPRTDKGIKVIPHTLLVADIITEIETFARDSQGAVRFIDQSEILAMAPESTREAKHPFSWRVEMS